MKYNLKDGREYIIRVANENDAEQVLDSLNSCGKETDFLGFGEEGNGLTLEEERNLLKNLSKSFYLLVAEVENKIVGTCSISVNEKRIRVQHIGEIGICIKKEFWGNSIGENLIKEIINYSKENGILKINLTTRFDNEKAINLYEKLGFKKEGVTTRGTYIKGKFYDILYMGLEL
ncbi:MULTISPECIES: GNAT family N-acetyltransferase [Fusobacterium]|uniref:GNAT family N-acetyltransferase n=1 Tax=Fusobacterium TaxID=848 RepID=UPI00147788B9|nr:MULTISPECIES: GNAT family N-acetyltransferase [Fusobacterium]MCI6151691.1 GNAT family N-acetyltransferase [Fusobacterium perfoetens]MDY3236553.1 GNAT family N-acetyltransferase [Fusobacterium perfoetens]NME36777.1 GNAT family N-acetyltransferase [Fusobacterium sp. FSA-380-WT-3A]